MLGYEPRQVTTQDCLVLCNLANMVIKEMQKDKLLLEKENSGQLLQRRNSKLNVISFAIYCNMLLSVTSSYQTSCKAGGCSWDCVAVTN